MTPSERLDEKIAYMKFRRAGGSLDGYLDEKEKQVQAKIQQDVEEVSKKLLKKQEQSNSQIDNLVKRIEQNDFLDPDKEQIIKKLNFKKRWLS
jgi:hypothetical protein